MEMHRFEISPDSLDCATCGLIEDDPIHLKRKVGAEEPKEQTPQETSPPQSNPKCPHCSMDPLSFHNRMVQSGEGLLWAIVWCVQCRATISFTCMGQPPQQPIPKYSPPQFNKRGKVRMN